MLYIDIIIHLATITKLISYNIIIHLRKSYFSQANIMISNLGKTNEHKLLEFNNDKQVSIEVNKSHSTNTSKYIIFPNWFNKLWQNLSLKSILKRIKCHRTP